MNQGASLLAAWQNFYVIVGTAAGALTGLQFVVLTLVAQARVASSARDIRAFGTPTVVHFCTALLMSAIMVAPWKSTAHLGICLAVGGTLGVVYSLSIFWHARKAAYNPDLEDWVWYTAFPLIAHVALLAAALSLWWNAPWSLCAVAIDCVAFLILGIHNSWDTVTYLAINHINNAPDPDKPN